MKKVLITSDSTTDLNADMIEKYQVKILPLGITLGDDHLYTDGVDIDPEFIYKTYEETGHLPKTSATNIDQSIRFFRKYVEEGYAIVHFTISASMSSTYQNACIAAQEFEDVYVVDTMNLSCGGALLVVKAGELMLAGKEASEIAKSCEALVPYIDASFVIDSLEFLHKGGRCSSVAALGASVLQLKPTIVVRDGAMSVGRKYRGKFPMVLKKYIKDTIGDASDIDKDHFIFVEAGIGDELSQMCIDLIKEQLGVDHLMICKAGCTISSHCGRNTIGLMFVRTHEVH